VEIKHSEHGDEPLVIRSFLLSLSPLQDDPRRYDLVIVLMDFWRKRQRRRRRQALVPSFLLPSSLLTFFLCMKRGWWPKTGEKVRHGWLGTVSLPFNLVQDAISDPNSEHCIWVVKQNVFDEIYGLWPLIVDLSNELKSQFWSLFVTLNFKDKIECINLMCAQRSVIHISRQITNSIIIVYITSWLIPSHSLYITKRNKRITLSRGSTIIGTVTWLTQT
jgi:hypothetical protein